MRELREHSVRPLTLADGRASGTLGRVSDEAEPYYTTDICTGCETVVYGLHGRWTCAVCGACSPYRPPPGGWQSDPDGAVSDVGTR